MAPHPQPLTRYVPLNLIDDFPMVSSLIDVDTKRWRAGLIRATFLPVEAETILSIPLSYSLPDDSIVWVGNKQGFFFC